MNSSALFLCLLWSILRSSFGFPTSAPSLSAQPSSSSQPSASLQPSTSNSPSLQDKLPPSPAPTISGGKKSSAKDGKTGKKTKSGYYDSSGSMKSTKSYMMRSYISPTTPTMLPKSKKSIETMKKVKSYGEMDNHVYKDYDQQYAW